MATRTISNAGGNWNSTGTWVEGAVPLIGDDVVATATSGNLTVTATAVCQTLNFTNYVGVFTINTGIVLSVGNGAVGGDVTLVAAMTYAGAGQLNCVGTGTYSLTSNGVVVSGTLNLGTANVSCTLNDNWTVNGTLFIGANSSTVYVYMFGNTIYCNGGFAPKKCTGTTTIVLQGSGAISGDTAAGHNTQLNITINTAGTYTIGNAGINLNCTFTLVSGTLTQSGNTNWTFSGTLSLVGTFPTFNKVTCNSASVTFNNTFNVTKVISGGSGSITFNGNQSVNVTTWTVNTTVSVITITRDAGVLSIGTMTAIDNATIIFAGAYDQTIGTLTLGSGVSFTFPSAKTLTVTAFSIDGSWDAPISIIAASTATSAFILALSGTPTAYKTIFVDVTVTGLTLYNFQGGTLTRTSGIVNFTSTPAGFTDPGISNVFLGVVYKINGGSNLVGTFQNPRSSGSIG